MLKEMKQLKVRIKVKVKSYLPHRFKHETEMVFVEEVSEQSDTVELVLGVSFVEFLEDPQLLETRLVHHLVIPDYLDGYFLARFQEVSCTHHVTENPLSRVPIYRVATIQLLPYTNTWKKLKQVSNHHQQERDNGEGDQVKGSLTIVSFIIVPVVQELWVIAGGI